MNTNYQSRGYLLDNYRLFHLNDAQGTKTDYHYHDFCKILLLHSGSGGYMVDGLRYSLEPGDIVLIGSHCVHRPEFEPGAPYERVILYIAPEFLINQSTGDCNLADCFSGSQGHVLRPEKASRKILFDLARRLEDEMSASCYGSEILCNSLLLHLLVEIGRQRSSTGTAPNPVQPGNGRIQDILRYIDGHLTEDLTIDHLSERFYLSKYHMMRLFRRETGQSIHNYLSDRRLLYARDMIRSGISATESCFRAGFRSYSSFTRAYAKRFGTTPTGRSAVMDESFE